MTSSSADAVPASRVADGPTDNLFYTNRCSVCGRCLTKLEILESFKPDSKPACPCGSSKFRSTNFKWWEELLLYRSWVMYFAIRRGEVAPPPTREQNVELRAKLIEGIAELEDQEDGERDIIGEGETEEFGAVH